MDIQDTKAVLKQSTTTDQSKAGEELKSLASRTLSQTKKSGAMESILGESLIKKREITYLAGAQMFFSDKNEVVMRKTPNLIMTPFDCIRQLKLIRTQIDNLKTAASFFGEVLSNWEKYTKEVVDEIS